MMMQQPLFCDILRLFRGIGLVIKMSFFKDNKLFGNGKFYINALSIAVPIMLQALIQSLVSLVDNFMVAGLGDVSMAGVNVSGQILFVFFVFINSICMAGGIFMTQFFGAKDSSGMQQAFRFKLIFGFLAFIPYFLVCIVFPKQVIYLMLNGNLQRDLILPEAVSYIRLMFFMGPQLTFSLSAASSFRDLGRVKFPLVVTIIATLTNTLFNWLLIYGNLGFPALGVKGAAIATVIARSLEFVIFAIALLVKKPEFSVKIKEFFKVDGKLIKEIFKKGSLVLFCEMVWIASETITSWIFNGRGGAEVVSGMSAGFAIANLFFVAFGGIYSATQVVIGKTLGEGNLDKARTEKTWLLSGSAIFGVIMMLFGFLTVLIVPFVFGKLSAEAITICTRMVILMAILTPVWVYMNSQTAIARAGGDTMMGAIADALITIFIMIPMLLGLGFLTSVGPVEIYLCVKLLDVVKVIVFTFWLKKERWLKNLTVKEESNESA